MHLLLLAGALSASAEPQSSGAPPQFVVPPSSIMPNSQMRGRYKLRGVEELKPSAISDDGAKTYIQWPPEVSLPAVFVIDDLGREALANGYMRDGAYVIDSVSNRLIFRIDRRVARADRVVLEEPR